MGQKLTIEKMQKIAMERGGECLSKEYINSKTKLKWQCKEGHEWEATPDNIKRSTWCPECSKEIRAKKRRLTIEEVQETAQKRGGECLSKKYVNARTKLRWRCKNGHTFENAFVNVKSQGQWCPYCAGRNKTIKDMQIIAQKRGGECLSPKYNGVKTKLRWKCREGHEWETTPDSIINKQRWCPKCSIGISERICIKTFENIFDTKFPKRKPKWLIKLNNARMELDGYNKELGLAFEYQGKQHYRFVDRFHKTEEDLLRRKQDDELKRTLCKQNKVVLIEVPYYIENEELRNYVISECRKRGIKIPSQALLNSFDYRTYDGIYSPEKLKKMQIIANEKGGLCLSKEYIDDKTKLRWRCKEGHEWEAVPSHIKQGKWCPYCIGRYKTIIDMHILAEKRGGKCLSPKYISNNTRLIWQCNNGHVWEAVPSSINHGSWCPHCVGRYVTIEEMQNIAKERGGECLSKQYKGALTKLKWQCEDGHTWESAPNNIKNGNWCPTCAIESNAKKRRLRIEEMRELAKQREGQCLSTEYLGKDTKLRWQCKKGHEWNSTPGSVKHQQSWCPICAGNVRLTLEEMQEIAKKRGGECLSTEYKGGRTKLRWRCEEGHEWENTPSHIKNRGQWCPTCAKK